MNAYRIVSPDYLGAQGIGVYRWGSRWLGPGRRAVHAAGTYSLAVLESLVHWQSGEMPAGLLCVVLEIPQDVPQETIRRSRLPPPGGRDYSEYRRLGNGWYDRGATAVLWTPSLVSPHESNALINQTHADYERIIVHGGMPVQVERDIFPAG